MRTGSTPAKSRTILCMRAVPSAALGVRRRLLRSGRRGRRRIVLTGPSLPPPLSLSGLQNRRRLGRRNQNRDRCPLWINRLALPDSRAVAAASRFIHSSAEAPIQPPTWLLQRHPTLVTKSPNKRTSRQPSTPTAQIDKPRVRIGLRARFDPQVLQIVSDLIGLLSCPRLVLDPDPGIAT